MRQVSAGIVVATRELEEALLTCLRDLPVRVLFGVARRGRRLFFPPFGQALKDALERIAKVREAARELAGRRCGKVLLADPDLESGLIGFLLKSKSAYSIADTARNLQHLDESHWHGLAAWSSCKQSDWKI